MTENIDTAVTSGGSTSPPEGQAGGKDQYSSAFRLAKVIGVAAIVASAVANEYGSGVNFVAPQSVGVYPNIEGLVPLAMLVTGIVLLPKVFLFMRFSKAMPTAGSTYAWISRTLSLPVAFVATIIWLVGFAGAIGVIAFTFGTFLGQAFASAGWPGAHALLTTQGHIIIGLAAIWVVFALHSTGIKNYSAFVQVLLGLIVISAVTMAIYGFTTPPAHFLSVAQLKTGVKLSQPSSGHASLSAFLSVMTLLVFAYGGINSAPTLGGETRNAKTTMSRGILLAWAVAIVLYTLVTLALFQVVPWWAVPELVKAGHSSLTTVPGLIGVIAPKAVAVAFSLLVALIVGKTLAPQLMASSRTLFALGQDHMLPDAVSKTNSRKAPIVALVIMAIAGSGFLFEISLTGFSAGVVVRSFSILIVLAVLAVGVLNVRFGQRSRFNGKPWAEAATHGWGPPVAAVLSIVVSVVLVHAVLSVAHKGIFYQPWFQTVLAIILGLILYVWAIIRAKRQHLNLGEIVAEAPLE
jgi:amino acid transporter